MLAGGLKRRRAARGVVHLILDGQQHRQARPDRKMGYVSKIWGPKAARFSSAGAQRLFAAVAFGEMGAAVEGRAGKSPRGTRPATAK